MHLGFRENTFQFDQIDRLCYFRSLYKYSHHYINLFSRIPHNVISLFVGLCMRKWKTIIRGRRKENALVFLLCFIFIMCMLVMLYNIFITVMIFSPAFIHHFIAWLISPPSFLRFIFSVYDEVLRWQNQFWNYFRHFWTWAFWRILALMLAV